MAPEEVQNEIKLIFARACAEGLKAEASGILKIEDICEKERTAKAYGEAFASAFIFVSRYFTGEVAESLPSAPAPSPGPSSSTPEAASPEREVLLYQLWQQSLKIQTLMQVRIDQLSAR